MKDHDAILGDATAKFDAALAEWTARTRLAKVAKLRAAAIDRRSRHTPAA
ncbi:MAG: hypothetical protein IPM41_13980 [Sphingomonadales bacterium]|nr:hypothetical protein [Sphingomonadales bacterium]